MKRFSKSMLIGLLFSYFLMSVDSVSLTNCDFEGFYNLGVKNYYGCGSESIKQDYKKAFNYILLYLQHDKQKKKSEAFLMLGKMYYYGEGTKQNFSEALKCFKKVESYSYSHKIKKREICAEAQSMRGKMYYYGEGVGQNNKKAYEELRKLLYQKDSLIAKAVACIILSKMYLYGEYLQDQNIDLAWAFIREAAKINVNLKEKIKHILIDVAITKRELEELKDEGQLGLCGELMLKKKTELEKLKNNGKLGLCGEK